MNRDQFYAGLLTPFLAALFGAVLGSAGTILVSQYEKASRQENLRVALTGEIEAILISIRMPALRTSWAWDGKSEKIEHHQFYYPRSVFDGNTAYLGALRDPELVRRISQLYSGLELAREEARRLDSGIKDSDSAVRYAHLLFGAYVKSVELVQELTGDVPRVYPGSTDKDRQLNSEAIKQDMEYLNKASRSLIKAAIHGDRSRANKGDKTSTEPVRTNAKQ